MLLFVLTFLLPCALGEHLLTLQGQELSRGLPACKDSSLLSCEKALVNYDALLTATQIKLPLGLTMTVSRNVESGDFNTLAFTLDNEEEGAQGVFVYHEENDKKYVSGSLNWAKESRHFKLEMCSHDEDCYTWSEVDATQWLSEASPIEASPARELNPEYERMMELGRIDNTTKVTYTVTVFVTEEFRSSFASPAAMKSFLNLAITESNQGYVNSQLPIVAKLRCVVDSPVEDNSNGDAMLDDILKAAGPPSNFNNFRRNADVAVVMSTLVRQGCGVAFTNSLSIGQTFGLVTKNCATGTYSFGHEIAHMAGCMHNREIVSTTPPFENGYGFLMRPPVQSGYRTIMAYKAPGYKTRVNVYSNPGINFRGIPTGTITDNNAIVLMTRRFAMAAVGNEHGKCY